LATLGPNEKNAKLGQKVSWGRLYISGTVEPRNFIFGMQIGHWAT